MLEKIIKRAIELSREIEEDAEMFTIRASSYSDDLTALSLAIMIVAKLKNVSDSQLSDAIMMSITSSFNIGYKAGKLAGGENLQVYQDNLADIDTDPSKGK